MENRILEKQRELESLQQILKLSKDAATYCNQLQLNMAQMAAHYEATLTIAKNWTDAFASSMLVEIPETVAQEEEEETPDEVVRIPIEDTNE
ncbi:hypothetical protein H4219_002122 [Mycoemilia scoparia]|uniref:Outer kinetochore protein DAD2 n=1 Tax=Mycoemilia scoparia TaxID=417184 RepID=A0A9W8DQY8_9FUNG|nr:hypothetical protein H4219_002122 [Mycoemilia scoparia]